MAVFSGIIGLAAFTVLILAVTTRTTWSLSSHVYLLFRAHDFGVVLQFLLLLPLAAGLARRASVSKVATTFGLAVISVTALLLLLGMGKVVNDMFYMLPQGLFGAWLIVVNLRLVGTLPPWLRYFGVVVGFGLVLVGTVFPGLALFVYPKMLWIPAVPVDQETFQNTAINRLLHQILPIGSILGVVTLPIWSILTGSQQIGKE